MLSWGPNNHSDGTLSITFTIPNGVTLYFQLKTRAGRAAPRDFPRANPVHPSSFTWIYILFKIGHFGDISDLLKYGCLKKLNSCKVSGICLSYHINIFSVALALLCT